MTKENTVKSHREFDAIIQKGARLRTDHFRLHYLPNGLSHSRIGIAVGKRNGGAVVRVAIKRQVRAMVAKADFSSLTIDLIIIVSPEYSRDHFHELEDELLTAINQIKEKRN